VTLVYMFFFMLPILMMHLKSRRRMWYETQTRGYKSSGSTSGPGFDSPWERISQDLMVFVLPVVGDIPVDSEVHVLTSSILRICQHSLRRCS
jgi:hypothetical protein